MVAAAQDETNTYTIGVGDVLRIDVHGVFGAPKDLVVRRDGTIDLAIAGNSLPASGLTAERVARLVENSISWLGRHSAEVTVIKFNSHAVVTYGKVSGPGLQFLSRDAVPVFVLRALADAEPDVDGISILRKDGTRIACSFAACDRQNVLIRTGDLVEFTSSSGIARSH
ncbi:MAG: polysaccharide biosynthesis/export protein [Acidobacteria bacterium OLB17]|nr:MAG: polysaccharide biosynthesis/export protein [Acidobacteria bacterium OLB17]